MNTWEKMLDERKILTLLPAEPAGAHISLGSWKLCLKTLSVHTRKLCFFLPLGEERSSKALGYV